MSEQWRIGRRFQQADWMGAPFFAMCDVREGGPEGGSRLVCSATPEDAEQIVRDHNAALAAQQPVERVLRERVWTLRPALALAVKRLRELYPHYEDHHEGGEIWRTIEIGEKALTDTAGPSARQPADLAPDEIPHVRPEPVATVTARLGEVRQGVPFIHPDDLAPDPRDAIIERLRGAIRDIHDDVVRNAYRHHITGRWALSMSDEVWSELRHLSVATDETIAAEEAALQASPERPAASEGDDGR